MKSLVGWDFQFSVETQEPVTHRRLEELLLAVIQWAEANSLVIGGGFHLQDEGAVSNTWHLCFGLCATLDDQLIPGTQAQELLDLINHWCSARDIIISGGFREFTNLRLIYVEEQTEP